MTPNPTPLTAYDITQGFMARLPYHTNVMDYVTIASNMRAEIEAYAAQQNAELVAMIEAVNEEADRRVAELLAENERLKQQLENTALLYERFRQAIDMGEMPVGWVDMDAEVEEVLGRGLKV